MTNEAAIRAAYEAWSRRDVEALLAVVHPDAEARPILGSNIGTDVYHGHDGLRQWFKDLHQEWETFETRVTRIDERGDRALCTFAVHARGRVSGVVIDGALYHLLDMRDGLILRLEAFQDQDAAMKALEAT
jgi:ketosteroid isomerase-like protein